MRTLAIILAGGAGKRMGTSTNKQFLILDNKPIIVHTLQIFEECRTVDGVYLVVNQKDLPIIQEEILETYKFNKVMKLVMGGRLRQDSVRNGLEAIENPCDIVIIHDGARPFISPSFI
jgi:2-C-methyl-D-erythritol 4-phosphate cytidylyltransferase